MGRGLVRCDMPPSRFVPACSYTKYTASGPTTQMGACLPPGCQLPAVTAGAATRLGCCGRAATCRLPALLCLSPAAALCCAVCCAARLLLHSRLAPPEQASTTLGNVSTQTAAQVRSVAGRCPSCSRAAGRSPAGSQHLLLGGCRLSTACTAQLWRRLASAHAPAWLFPVQPLRYFFSFCRRIPRGCLRDCVDAGH